MKYRREINGLRAIAVIPVVLFHAGLEVFSGGFIGVDIFFVISGYLITTIILSEKDQGVFSLSTFYERRARRILPALFFVIIASLPFAWLFLLPSDLKDFFQSLVAVITFSSNILFWKETGYWGTENELKPLLHTWSLAVEEQYYILFPLFLILMQRFHKRWLISSFLAIIATGLCLSQWGAYNAPVANFFLLPFRSWELAIGACIAFYFLYINSNTPCTKPHNTLNELLSGLGLALIFYAIFMFDESTPFPSLYTLIPTLGTALVILFSSANTFVGRLLSTKALVGIGLISYSAYLWHQPLIAFSRHSSSTEPNQFVLLTMATLSFPLAYLTWRFIENPFRKKENFNRKAVFKLSIIGSLAFLLIGISGQYFDVFRSSSEVPPSVINSIKRIEAPCFDRNHADTADTWLCPINGETLRQKPDFIAIGDSHMYAFLPGLKILASEHTYFGSYVGFSGCPPLLGVHSLRSDQHIKNCHNLNNRVFDYVKKHDIKNIVLVARWSYYTDGKYSGGGINEIGTSPTDKKSKNHSRQTFNIAIHETLKRYGELGVSIHILLQVPMQKNNPNSIYYESYIGGEFNQKFFSSKAIRREQHMQLQSYVNNKIRKAAADLAINSIQIYDPKNILCDAVMCRFGTKDTSFYFDNDHLSISGAKFVGKNIQFNFKQ